MVNRILNIVCWIGIALVLVAVAIRLVFPTLFVGGSHTGRL